MTSLEKKCFLLKEENMILKDDINHLRRIIEDLKQDKCEMKVELKMIKSKSVEFKYFSKDGGEAVKELLEILNKDKNFTYNKHRYGEIEDAYYCVYSSIGNYIFVIENYNEGRASKGLLTTPSPSHINENLKDKYDKLEWSPFGGATTKRKKYDFRGKHIIEVMDILNEFI